MGWSLEPRGVLIFVGGIIGATTVYLMDKPPIVVLGGALAAVGIVDSVVYLTSIQSPESFHRQAGIRFLMSTILAVLIILYQAIIDTSPPPKRIPLLIVYISLAIYGVATLYDRSIKLINKSMK